MACINIAVHCQDTKLLEVVATFQPSAFQLMDAQEAVAGVLEEHWYDKILITHFKINIMLIGLINM